MNCPRCNGINLHKSGFTNAGNQKYKCKDCGRVFTSNGILISKIHREPCPRCGSANTKKGGHNKYGVQKYFCNDCKKGFSESTVVRDPISVICPKCGGTHINRCGYTREGEQRYICKSCNSKFGGTKNKPLPYHNVTCPRCGHTKGKKAAFDKQGNQYYKCCKCNHKFKLQQSMRQITDKERVSIQCLHEQGIPVPTLSNSYKCCEKTIRNIVKESPESMYPRLTDKQIKDIIYFHIKLSIPSIDISRYIGCSSKVCEYVALIHKNIKPIPRREYIRSNEEKAQDLMILNKFIT